MGQLTNTNQGSKYTDEDRRHAIASYIVLGNLAKTSEITGIPRTTLHDWQHNTEWWADEVEKVRREKSDELDASYTNTIHAIQEQILDRVTEGDYVLGRGVIEAKDGSKTTEIVRKPMSGKDLATVGGIQFDKRQIGRNLPTTISASTDSARLAQLRDEFIKIAQAKTIEGEVIPRSK